jgi:ribosomal protein S18 acetylase RimI-like enzyme
MTAMTPEHSSPRWIRARVAHHVRDLARSTRFYGGLLALPRHGGFAGHDGFDGEFFALPGGGELELTTGPGTTGDPTEEPLVLYLGTLPEVHAAAAGLEAAGVPAVPAANPYWNRWGRTFLDPDGRAVVVAATDSRAAPDLRIEPYTGGRDALRELFELAEDSPTQLDSYLAAGRVLVALADQDPVGHLQLVPSEEGVVEIKNMAVRPQWQGRGVGARLVAAAVEMVTAEPSGATMVVATAAADVGNLRFYQRQGFRMRSIERDAFTPATGYPWGLLIDGVQLRDRVWLDRRLGATR